MARNPHEIVTLDDQPDNEPDDFSHDWRRKYHELESAYEMLRARHGQLESAVVEMKPAKPMRIRCMELPGEINPNTNELITPFVIVFDRVTGGPLGLGTSNAIALNTGARGVLVFEQEIQIGDD